jgi:large subunit ribosomal protein L22
MFVKKVARARYLRIGDRKLRQIARTIKGLRAGQALERLNFAAKRKLATTLAKTLKSAVANAMEVDLGGKKLQPEELLITMVAVDSGPIQKRMEFRAMGRANRIQKRYCHLTIEVSGYATESDSGTRSTKKKAAKKKTVKKKTATKKVAAKSPVAKKKATGGADKKSTAKKTVTKKAATKKAATKKTVAKKADAPKGQDSGKESK